MSKHPYRSTSRTPLYSELVVMTVVAVLLTYWTVMLVVGIGRANDGLGARVKGVVIENDTTVTTPSTTPAITYQPVPAP